jgi:hypothetical protein
MITAWKCKVDETLGLLLSLTVGSECRLMHWTDGGKPGIVIAQLFMRGGDHVVHNTSMRILFQVFYSSQKK